MKVPTSWIINHLVKTLQSSSYFFKLSLSTSTFLQHNIYSHSLSVSRGRGTTNSSIELCTSKPTTYYNRTSKYLSYLIKSSSCVSDIGSFTPARSIFYSSFIAVLLWIASPIVKYLDIFSFLSTPIEEQPTIKIYR